MACRDLALGELEGLAIRVLPAGAGNAVKDSWGVGFRCTWPSAPRTSAFSRSEKPRICQPCSVKMLNGVTVRGRFMA